MKIIHISSYAFISGAGRAAYRLHDGLRRLNADSSMLVCPMERAGERVVPFKSGIGIISRIRRYYHRLQIQRGLDRYIQVRPEGLEPFSSDHSRYGYELVEALVNCDLVHLHWISGFIDLPEFLSAVPSKKDVIWTLHDMNLFTGGCHYSLGCSRYRHGCGRCPQLGSSDSRDPSWQIWRRKQRLFSEIAPDRLQIVTPSRWLADEVKTSPLLNRFPLAVIPYGIDTDVFFPRDKMSSRVALGMEPMTNVILFLAHNVNIKRKGLEMLHMALQHIENKDNYCLLSIGRGNTFQDLGFRHIHLGKIENDRILAGVISAAGLFVIPSQQDNLPNTVLESMACGTPVLGFDAGGIPEMVREGVTGYLVRNGDVKGLSNQIAALFADPQHLQRLSINCRQISITDYRISVSAERYLALYTQVCERQANQ